MQVCFRLLAAPMAMRRAPAVVPRPLAPPRALARPVSSHVPQRPALPLRSFLQRPPANLLARRFANAASPPPSKPAPRHAQAPSATNAAPAAAAPKSDISADDWSEKNEDTFRQIANLLHDNKHFQVRHFRLQRALTRTQAEGMLRNAIQEITRRFGAEHQLLEEPMWALANAFMAQRKLNEAVQCWKRIVFLAEKWHGQKDLLVARAHLFLAQTYVLMDRVMDAEKEYANVCPPTHAECVLQERDLHGDLQDLAVRT